MHFMLLKVIKSLKKVKRLQSWQVKANWDVLKKHHKHLKKYEGPTESHEQQFFVK
jgi:hypothetical protein